LRPWLASLFFVGIFSIHPEELKGVWKISETKILFLSETELETTKGKGTRATGKIDFGSKTSRIEIDLTDFRTPNKLQTSHMQENYLETDSFPSAIWEGQLLEWNPKERKGILEGNLNLHGVTKSKVRIPFQGKDTKEGIETLSEFVVDLRDHKIEIPKLLILKLNPEIKIKATFVWQKEN